MVLSIILLILIITGDQVSKYFIAQYFEEVEGRTLPIIENIFHFTYVENTGAAFGMLSEHRWVFMVLSVIGIGALAIWLAIEKPKSIWLCSSVAFILGGGIGNMIDRIRLGYVIDFIDCRFIDFYVFNVADSFVCIGCAMFFIYFIADEIRESKKKKEQSISASENEETRSEENDG